MNTELQIKKFLSSLSEAFPGVAKTATLEIYYQTLKADLAKTDLIKLQQKLINTCEFFPTVKTIRDNLGLNKQGPRELATEFVDAMLAVLQGPGNAYEIAGADNYKFWMRVIGVNRFDLQNMDDPRFYRSQWIDKLERAYNGDNVLKFERKMSVADLMASAPKKAISGKSEA